MTARRLIKSQIIQLFVGLAVAALFAAVFLGARIAATYQVEASDPVMGKYYGDKIICDLSETPKVSIRSYRPLSLDRTLASTSRDAVYSMEYAGNTLYFLETSGLYDEEICKRSFVTNDGNYAVLAWNQSETKEDIYVYDLKSEQNVELSEIKYASETGLHFFTWQEPTTLGLLQTTGKKISFTTVKLANGEKVLETKNLITGAGFPEDTVTITTSKGDIAAYIADGELEIWDLRPHLAGLKDYKVDLSEKINYNPFKSMLSATYLVKDGEKPVTYITLSKRTTSGTACTQQLSGLEYCNLAMKLK